MTTSHFSEPLAPLNKKVSRTLCNNPAVVERLGGSGKGSGTVGDEIKRIKSRVVKL